MSHGYSMSLAFANQKADVSNPGVTLGRFCIERNIPVAQVASELSVSRMTIYNWFCGYSKPTRENIEAIERFKGRHKRRK
jgi:transcriptional regulator with XRE-family HTH domain